MARRVDPSTEPFRKNRIQRGLHGALVATLLGAAVTAAAPAAVDEHGAAVSALSDLKAAVSEIDHAERLTVNGPDAYRRDAQRAINDLVGRDDPRYDAASGARADPAGALGHLNWLTDRSGTTPWANPLSAARVNALAAVARLQEALKADDLTDFQVDVSDALSNIEMAIGRSTEVGPLGGVSGALANTTLGIPAHGRVVNGCTPPAAVPAYGVAGGYLLYVAVPPSAPTTTLPEALGTQVVTREGDAMILHTAAAAKASALCSAAASADPASTAADPSVATDPPSGHKGDSSHASLASTGLYTVEQAEAGRKIFDHQCVACHGKNLQGVSAPSVAGNDFLDNAHRNKWTLDDLRSIVVYNMPFNAPGSLSKKEYADVLAYLLASNCYPAGSKPFPEQESPQLRNITIGHPERAHPSDQQLGTCSVSAMSKGSAGKQRAAQSG